jgi:hypothetical protein
MFIETYRASSNRTISFSRYHPPPKRRLMACDPSLESKLRYLVLLDSLRYPLSVMNEGIEEIRKLFPAYSDEDLALARENIDRYLEAIWDIWMEKRARSSASFDGHDIPSYDGVKVDSPKTN